MAERSPTPAERVIALAAYLKSRRGSQITLGDVTRDVPGYEDGAAKREQHGELAVDTPEWETLRKKVQRDLRDLAEHWGIQVEWVEGFKSYVLKPPFFSPHERAALIAAAAAVDVDGPGDAQPGEIGAAVDDSFVAIVVGVPDVVTALRDACQTRTPVRFVHGGALRVLEPYALGQWANHWYIAGWSPGDNAMRRYRLDRIEQPRERDAIEFAGTAGSYEVPDWFDSALAFDMDPNSWGHDPVLHARVRVGLDHVPTFIAEVGGQVVAISDADATVALTVRHYQWTRDRCFGFRGHAVPLDPPELVRLVRDHLRAIVGPTS